MGIAFDDGAADSLVRVAGTAARVLRDQGAPRRTAAEDAARDFRGAFATLFEQACGIEFEDRIRLARVLEDLAGDLAAAKTLAQRERDRQTALSEWQSREDQRDRDRATDPTGALHADSAQTDPRPSEDVVAAPTISAAFVPRERPRTARASSTEKTSADPVTLQGFVTHARAANTALKAEVTTIRNAWVGFANACSWVHLGTVTFTGGFERMLAENRADTTWIERVATQFEKAGGGSLTTTALNKAAVSVVLDVAKGKKFQKLLDGKLSPAEAAEYWNSLGLDADEVRLLPAATLLKLASLSGLPASAQDAASREFLDFALKNPRKAYELAGFVDPYTYSLEGQRQRTGSAISVPEFTERLHALKNALAQAEKDANRLPGRPVVQFIGLGAHDGALVAAVSTGDVDSASHVGVNVSGMNSDVKDMVNGDKAAGELYKNAKRQNPSGSFAVVNWIGYRSPTLPREVHSMRHAESGADQLTSFLNGINASRNESGMPVRRSNVYSHSYGSTVAVEALKQIDFDIDALVTYGSAGVKNDTTIDELRTDRVYSTHADGDGIAKLGQFGAKSLDPRDMDGVFEFSSEDTVTAGGNEFKKTTMHDMYREDDEWSLWNPEGSVGYLSPGSTSLDQMGSMLANGDSA